MTPSMGEGILTFSDFSIATIYRHFFSIIYIPIISHILIAFLFTAVIFQRIIFRRTATDYIDREN
jgi:hypothetical protein